MNSSPASVQPATEDVMDVALQSVIARTMAFIAAHPELHGSPAELKQATIDYINTLR